jgi:hypothetical protein|tara:strand:+ start:237 stop:377 length:141 start_codon:yes stop_codon:yes gene_type:complete
MIKKILLIFITITLASCSTIKEKIPNIGQKPCTDSKDTLADIFCKK